MQVKLVDMGSPLSCLYEREAEGVCILALQKIFMEQNLTLECNNTLNSLAGESDVELLWISSYNEIRWIKITNKLARLGAGRSLRSELAVEISYTQINE